MLLGITISLLLTTVAGHGRMISPMTRVGHTRYEGDPVGFDKGLTNVGNTIEDWICRHSKAKVASTEVWTSGKSVELEFDFGVNHVGFCDGMLSYDFDKPRSEMRWFKIANWIECGSTKKLTMELPSFLPSGRAVFRWSWTALHHWPVPEVFAQCADIEIKRDDNDKKNVNDLGIHTFSIINPQLYPRSAKDDDKIQGVTFADPYNGDERDRVVGPPCALGFAGNSCELTKPGASGFINPQLLEGGHTAPPKSSTSTSSTASSSSTSTTTTTTTTTSKTNSGNSGSSCTSKEPRFETWCQDNCKVDRDFCLNSGLCTCSESTSKPETTSTTTTTTSKPDTTTTSTTSKPATETTTPKPTESSSTSTTDGSSESDEVRMCYFTNWARYRTGLVNRQKDLFEMGMDTTLCTHITYGFGSINPHDFGLKAFDPNADHPTGDVSQTTLCPKQCVPGYKHDWNQGSHNPCQWPCSPDRKMRGFEGLTVWAKKKNPDLKALLSVGGWNFNDCLFTQQAGQGKDSCEIFTTIAGSEKNSRTHALQVIDFLRNWGFDGYDIDWEYPVVAGHNDLSLKATPQDFKNYIRLLKILKEEFEAEAVRTNRPRLLLTAAVGVGKSTVDQAYDIPHMAQTLDLIGLMTYDLHGTWEPQTGFHSALYATEDDVSVYKYPISVSWAVDYWIQHGAKRNQLLLGVASYGRGWKLQDSQCTKPLCPTSGSAKKGVSTKQEGFLAYYEVEDMLARGVATRYFDNDRKVPYVVTNDGEWIGYEDVESMRIKLEYLKSENLRGTLLWAMDLDDIQSFPLMKEIKSGLAGYQPTGTSGSTTTAAVTTRHPTAAVTTRRPTALTTRRPTVVTTVRPTFSSVSTSDPLPTTPGSGPTCYSIAAHIPDSWCVSNCKVDIDFCLKSNFCICKMNAPATSRLLETQLPHQTNAPSARSTQMPSAMDAQTNAPSAPSALSQKPTASQTNAPSAPSALSQKPTASQTTMDAQMNVPSALSTQMPSAMLSTESATTDLADSSRSLTDMPKPSTEKPKECPSGYKSMDTLLTDAQCNKLCEFNSEACESAVRARKCVCGGSAVVVNAENGAEMASSVAFILILLSLV